MTNPNKTPVRVYREDVDRLLLELELCQEENEQLHHLIDGFLSVSNTKLEFIDYLNQLKKQEEDNQNFYWLHLNDYIQYFS